MNKTDLRNIIAKLHEIESPTKIEVPVKEGALDFLKGLGAGEAKAIPKVKPRVEPTLEPRVPAQGATGVAGQGAEQAVASALGDANKKLTLLRKITPAEAAAARAEGKTLDELLFNKYPETFAKFEKDPQLATSISKEFSKAADEIMTAGERGPSWLRPEEEKYGKRSLAGSALTHALIVLGLLIVNKNSSDTSKEKTANTTTSDSDKSSASSQGSSKIPADEISWTTLGINPKAYEGSSLEKSSLDGSWRIVTPTGRTGGYIKDPEMIKKVEKMVSMSSEERKNAKRATDNPTFIVSQDEWDKMKPSANKQPEADIGVKKPAASEPSPEIVKKKKKKDEKVLPASQW